MYGLEKEKGKAPFEFDLEQELKKDPKKLKQHIKTVEEKIQEIKEHLRKGSGSQDFDNYGVLLHGYTSLQKVLTKIANYK